MNFFGTVKNKLFSLRNLDTRPIPQWFAYLLAVALPILTVWGCYVAGVTIGDHAAANLFLIPVLLSACFGGLRAGLISAILGAVLAYYFPVAPAQSLYGEAPVIRVQWIVYLITALLGSIIIEFLHRSLKKSKEIIRGQSALPKDLSFLSVTSPAVFFSCQLLPDGSIRIPYADNRVKEIFGYGPEILAQEGAMIFTSIHSDDLDYVREAIKESARTLLPWHSEFRVYHPRHEEILVEVRSAPQREQDGSVRWYGFVTDITEREKSESALQQSEERYATIVNTVHDAIILHDLAGQVLDVNQTMLTLFGITREEALKMTVFQDLSGPGNPTYTLPALWNRAVHGEKITFEWNAQRPKEGVVFPVEVWLQRITLGDQNLILSTVRDITERRQAEEKFKQLAGLQQTILDTITPGLIFVKERVQQWANASFCKIFGYEAAEVQDIETEQLYADVEDYRKVGIEAYPYLALGDIYSKELHMKRKDGSIFWCNIVGKAINPENPYEGAIWMLQDITERKQAEETLRTSEARFRGIADNLPGVVFQFYARANGAMGFYYVSDLSVPLLSLDNKNIDTVFKLFTDNIAPDDREKFSTSVLHAVQSVSKWDFEGKYIKPGGEEISLRGIAQPRKVGNELIFDGVLLDITERKDTEGKIKQLLELQQTILETITPGLTFVKDRQHQWGNSSFCQMFGYEAAEAVSVPTKAFYADMADYEQVGIEAYPLLARGDIYSKELQMKRKDGSIFWCYLSGKAINPEKPYEGTVWMLQDITERRQAEEKIKQFAELQQTILDTITPGLTYVENRRVQWSNEAFGKIFGYEAAEARDIETAELYANVEDYKKVGKEGYAQLVRGDIYAQEIQMKKKDGSLFWCHMVGKALTSKNYSKGSIWMLQDITERKEAEEKFKQLAELHQTILDTITPSLAFVKDRRMLWSNAAFGKIFGYDAEEMRGLETEQVYADVEDYRKVGIEAYPLLARGDIYSLELQLKRKDGSIFWAYMVGKAVNPENPSEGSIWMTQDITERKKAEEALITSQSLLRDSQRVAHIGCWDLAVKENRLFWNEGACEIYGFRYQEFQPTFDDFMALVHPDDRGVLLPHLQECLETGQFRDYECRIVRRDGTARRIYVTGKVVADESGKPYRVFGIVQDITERKKAEEDKALLETQLIQAQKMESVGRLAGGVAHDFNNMLSVILGCVDLIKSELPGSYPFLKEVLEIEKAATRSADITRQLLAFSRKQVITLKTIELNSLITATLKTLHRLIGEDIELRFQPCNELWKIKFDPSQIDQILINLAVNARDAMSGGGILDIKTENVYVDEAYCMEHIEYMPGDYVVLAVSDNGMGMDRETLSHIFEPFFTTKEVGKGTGLGLATIYGIVKQNGGFINVYSEPGQGSTFRIYIPRNMEDEVSDERVAATPMSQVTGTVLLVEDDEMVREITRNILEKIGYTVLVTENPLEALSFCEKKDVSIDLLITDVIMPKMSGKDLRDRVEAIRPGIKVLFMSGYTADIIAHSGVLEEGVNFIQKPFSRNDLARKVNEIIREK